MEGYLAEMRGFAGNFAPRGWMLCDGQSLSISQHTELFSLIGTIYGGDGRTTFNLPDFRGRAFIGSGTGPGLNTRNLGAKTGSETVTLKINEIPSHTHSLNCNGTSGSGNQNSPHNHFPGVGQTDRSTGDPINTNWATAANTTMNASAITNNGGSQSHTNMQPSLASNWIICTSGIYPSRG